MHGLRGIRVFDFTSRIAGAYCTKLFVDAGAEVIKIEPAEGDPMRSWSATGADTRAEDGALFRFLNAGKRSYTAPDDVTPSLIAGADLIVDDFLPSQDPGCLKTPDPGRVRLSITPFGRHGPWAERPATEFTLQAESGSIGGRGLAGQEPFQAGGRVTEWLGGTFAAVAALAAVRRAQHTGTGEEIDFSLLEVMTIASSNYLDLTFRLLGVQEHAGSIQSIETPSIEPTRDGFVGFCTNSAQQFSDFLLLIERPDLRDDEVLFNVAGRGARYDEWNAIVRKFTRERTTAEIVEAASLLRIPVAPVNNGKTVLEHEQLVAREAFIRAPDGGFRQPAPPYRIDGERPSVTRRAPRVGEDNDRIESRSRPQPRSADASGLPLSGLRIVDFTSWWAGPSATHMLACLGADVIHVESVGRIDGMRTTGGMMAMQEPRWWECSAFFLSTNTNKRGLTLDLTDPECVGIAKRLIADADAVVENFTPRVMENFGLDWKAIQETNPQTLFVRMPAFGLDGPWRDRTGFAQTMEQMTGLAWLTGHTDDQPRIQRGPCDPLAGMHGAFALLVGLAERAHRGRGVHVEVAMVEGALNAAAEQSVEFTAYGSLMEREGNRTPSTAPQGLYACAGHSVDTPRWLALSVETDAQWQALQNALGGPAWALDPLLETRAGRRRGQDGIDASLREVFANLTLEAGVDLLVAAGVPAAAVRDPRTTSANPQHAARGFYETLDHRVVGAHPIATVPFRYRSVDHWLRSAAPTLGQHNREILGELGVSPEQIDALEAAGLVGEHPTGK
jgi:crotonobetainyl-CoA:carnitine CoA-transferase CaiB-like acyl-CoA transferase